MASMVAQVSVSAFVLGTTKASQMLWMSAKSKGALPLRALNLLIQVNFSNRVEYWAQWQELGGTFPGRALIGP